MLAGVFGQVRGYCRYKMMTQRSARASVAFQLGSSPIRHLAVEPKYCLHIIWRLPVYSLSQYTGFSHEYLRWNAVFEWKKRRTGTLCLRNPNAEGVRRGAVGTEDEVLKAQGVSMQLGVSSPTGPPNDIWCIFGLVWSWRAIV